MGITRLHTIEQSRTVSLAAHAYLDHLLNIGKAANPNCAQGIMQWQHGTYTQDTNGSLSLEPIAVDGRQLLSSPCEYKNAVFTRYHQPELIKVRQS